MLNKLNVWNADGTPKAAGEQQSRFTASLQYAFLSTKRVETMDSIRDSVDNTALGGAGNAVAFAEAFLQYEQYKRIGGEALRNIALAFVMIAVVILLLLGNILASVVTIFCVCSAVVEVVGFMHLWGLTIDSVVVIFVVISLGLSVDYSAHIAHGYLFAHGDKSQRRQTCLVDTGAAVFNGGASTMLAVILLSSAATYVF